MSFDNQVQYSVFTETSYPTPIMCVELVRTHKLSIVSQKMLFRTRFCLYLLCSSREHSIDMIVKPKHTSLTSYKN